MKTLLTGSLLAVALSQQLVHAQEQATHKNGCTACHSVNERIVGPAFHEIAERYKEKPNALDYLTGKILGGGVGVWGQIPMPMHPAISNEDAKAMAAWILTR